MLQDDNLILVSQAEKRQNHKTPEKSKPARREIKLELRLDERPEETSQIRQKVCKKPKQNDETARTLHSCVISQTLLVPDLSERRTTPPQARSIRVRKQKTIFAKKKQV